MPPKGRGTWWVLAMPSRLLSEASAVVTSAPRKRTVPPDDARPPASTLSNVVFPAPLGPTMPTASSAATEKLTSSRTVSAPNRLQSPAPLRIAPVGGEATAAGSTVVGVQLSLDGNVLVVGVLGDDHVELILAARLGLDPLASDDVGVEAVRHGPLGEVDHADGRRRLKRADGLGDARLVERVPARLQGSNSGVE